MRILLFLSLLLAACSASPLRGPAAKLLPPEKETSDYDEGVAAWNALKAAQQAPCDPALDSLATLRGHKTKLSVIVLHGYSSNPAEMQQFIDLFANYDVNVLTPRLAYHFDKDITDLDKAKFTDWTAQTDRVYSIAKQLGYDVVILGYSLGGLLGTRLALLDPEHVYATVLLSPAWRLNGDIQDGLWVSWFLGISPDQYLSITPACNTANAYISAGGGLQVAALITDIENKQHGTFPGIDGSAMMRMTTETPTFVATLDQDQVVNSDLVRQMQIPDDSGFRTLLVFHGSNHGTLTEATVEQLSFDPSASKTPYPGTHLMEQITAFLKDKASLEPLAKPRQP